MSSYVLRALLSTQEPSTTLSITPRTPSLLTSQDRFSQEFKAGRTLLVAKPTTMFPPFLAGQVPTVFWCP